MAPSPPPAAGSRPPAGKSLSLRSPWTWVIIGGIALAGGALILYRNRKAASSGTGSASGASPDYSGALGTLQDEIGNLQSGTGGTTAVPVTDPSGGSGSSTPAGGPSSGGNPPGASDPSGSGSGGDSGGSSSSGGGGTTTTTVPKVTNGRMLSHYASGAVIAWDGPGASVWDVTRFGPGSPNGITNRVYTPVAVYSGLAAGHTYYSMIQPIVNGQKAGQPGRVDFNTKV